MNRLRWTLPVLILASCSQSAERPDTPGSRLTPGRSQMYVAQDVPGVYTDPGTGCQYLVLYTHALTPRLSRSGGPICPGTNTERKEP